MRAVFGLLLVMLGLAMAVVWMPEHHGERQLAVVTDIATKGIQRAPERGAVVIYEDKSGRTFSPHTPLLTTVEPQSARVPHSVNVARIVAPEATARTVTPSGTPSGPLVTASLPTATVVEPAPVLTVPMLRSAESTLPRSPGANEMNREELVRNIQRELKRVGCYAGDVDGDWGSGSRRAMATFTDRVNASLPIDQPDFILLTLLRGHSGTGCSGTSATVAQPRRTTERRIAAVENGSSIWSSNVVTAAPLRAAEQPAAPVPTVSAAPAALAAVAAAAVAAQAAQAQAQPLPWRMAVGGPQNGSAYVTNPPERSPSRAAVRSAEPAAPAATPVARAPSRERSRRAAPYRRAAPLVAYAYRYPVPPVGIYRPAPPRSYASAPGRRGSRGWTANFFGNNP